MKKLVSGLAAASLLFIASQAFADDCCCRCDKSSSESKGEKSSGIAWNLSTYAGAGLQEGAFRRWTALKGYQDGSIVSRADDSTDRGYRIFAGLNFLQHFALEAGYFDAGTARYSAQSDGSGSYFAAGPIVEELSLKGIDLSVLGRMPVAGRFSAYGQLGWYAGHSERRGSGADQFVGPYSYSRSDAPRGLLAGAGVEYQAMPELRVTAAYDHRAISHAGLGTHVYVESISLDIAYLF